MSTEEERVSIKYPIESVPATIIHQKPSGLTPTTVMSKRPSYQQASQGDRLIHSQRFAVAVLLRHQIGNFGKAGIASGF